MPRKQIKDQHGLHFITCTVVGWIDIFSRQRYKEIVINSLDFCIQNKGLLVHTYVIMSNHIHLIISVHHDSEYSISEILRDFKKFTANTILESIQQEPESRREWLMHMFKYFAKYNTNNRNHQFWIQDNYPIPLYTQKVTWQKINYIHMNPVKAGIVEKPEHYLYSSAASYKAGQSVGPLKVHLLEPYWSDKGLVF